MKLSYLLVFCLPFLAWGQDTGALQKINRLNAVSDSLKLSGAFEQAIENTQKAKQIALEQFGESSVVHANVCFKLGSIYDDQGELPSAEQWYLDAKKHLETGRSRQDTLLANVLNNLGTLYMQQGNFDQAMSFVLRAKSMRDSLFNGNHPDCARSLSNLATLCYYQGNYEPLDSLWNAAISIWERSGLTRERDYFMCLNNLAGTYLTIGKLDESEQIFLRVRDLRATYFGTENHDYAMVLNNLGAVYEEKGDYEKAARFFSEAVDILVKVFGELNGDAAFSMSNLGYCYRNLGNTELAETWLLKAIGIQEKTIGKTHPRYAGSLNNLAILYSDMGINDKAFLLYQEANGIEREVLGETHPQYAASLLNIAAMLHEAGDYEKAALLYEEAGTIFENAFGKENQWYLEYEGNVALLYRDMQQYAKAEAKYLETLEIESRILGKEHPGYAETLNNLAVLYSDMGDEKKALNMHLDAKKIRESTLGTEHPHYLESIRNLSRSYVALKQPEAAAPLLIDGFEIEKKLLRKAFSHLSERELAAFTQKFNQQLDFSFLVGGKQPDMTGLCFDELLFYKGFLLQGISQIRKLTLANPDAERVYQQLKSVHYQLAAEYTKSQDEQLKTPQLEARADSLEKTLTRMVSGFGDALQQPDWKNVQRQLNAAEAAIEFFQYNSGSPASIRYAALVLTKSAEKPIMVELFEQQALSALIDLKGKPQPELLNALYTGADGAQLYAALWKPLEPVLKNIKTVYFSPSGLLNRLNLGAIPISEKETLADRFELVQLNSTRQLVRPEDNAQVYQNTAILYGGIQYEVDGTMTHAPDSTMFDLQKNTRSRGFEFSVSSDPGTRKSWQYLRWTDIEIAATADILAATGFRPIVYRTNLATEEAFKSIGVRQSAPRILHLATHGFFFPDPLGTSQSKSNAGQNFTTTGHLLMRSGLILAGGNYAWQYHKPFQAGGEDGILTAYEISQMDLRNTELVVLSACETGLGEIRDSEGVYGLQRAFKIAGAKYLIMSLWQTSDFHTQELMTAFYANWMERKMTIPAAFDAAQKAMKIKYRDPFYWAGFILVE